MHPLLAATGQNQKKSVAASEDTSYAAMSWLSPASLWFTDASYY